MDSVDGQAFQDDIALNTSQRRRLRQCLADQIAAAKEELPLSISELILMLPSFPIECLGDVVGDGWFLSSFLAESLLSRRLYTSRDSILESFILWIFARFIVRIYFFGLVHCEWGEVVETLESVADRRC